MTKPATLAGSRNGKLKAAPIMVYPTSPEQRAAFQKAADQQGRKLSAFMVFCAEQYIAPGAAARQRIEQHEAFGLWKDFPEDGLAFQDRMRSEWD